MEGEKYHAGEAPASWSKDVDFLTVNTSNGGIEILLRGMFDPYSPTQVSHVQAGNGARLLPKIFTHAF